MRLTLLLLLLLTGAGIVIYSIVGLGLGIKSMISDGNIFLLLPANKLSIWPLNLLAAIFFLLKQFFILCFGMGFVAFGLFYGLRSDVMYLPAMGGLLIGLIGNTIVDLLANTLLF